MTGDKENANAAMRKILNLVRANMLQPEPSIEDGIAELGRPLHESNPFSFMSNKKNNKAKRWLKGKYATYGIPGFGRYRNYVTSPPEF